MMHFIKLLTDNGCFSVSQSVMSDSLQPHGLQHTRLLCPLLAPGVITDTFN